MIKKRPLKVGFDLDGVLLYNPARVVRMPISIVKRILLRKKELKFYYPTSPFQQNMWKIFHWSSIFIAPGFHEIEKLVHEGKIEAYIVTARWSFLKDDLNHWLKRMNIDSTFKGVYQNLENEQPHLFKERMIEKLGLDLFVEDNIDIVRHIRKHPKTKIFWIRNILDVFIDHPHTFPTLKSALHKIHDMT